MTDEEAQAMLKQLSEHFREPVMPVSKYCAALDTWHRALITEGSGRSKSSSNEELASMVSHVFLQIRKSNLLYRLIYAGETLRTEKCPDHKGRWSGCSWSDTPCECQKMQNGKYDSNVTGWLP